jgi:hypothetical protein
MFFYWQDGYYNFEVLIPEALIENEVLGTARDNYILEFEKTS